MPTARKATLKNRPNFDHILFEYLGQPMNFSVDPYIYKYGQMQKYLWLVSAVNFTSKPSQMVSLFNISMMIS